MEDFLRLASPIRRRSRQSSPTLSSAVFRDRGDDLATLGRVVANFDSEGRRAVNGDVLVALLVYRRGAAISGATFP
jgi:hypothetical protein